MLKSPGTAAAPTMALTLVVAVTGCTGTPEADDAPAPGATTPAGVRTSPPADPSAGDPSPPAPSSGTGTPPPSAAAPPTSDTPVEAAPPAPPAPFPTSSTAPTHGAGAGSGTTDVPVVVTYSGVTGAGDVEVGGYVDGLTESDGTCTLTLTSDGSSSVSRSSTAVPDATTTSCGGVSVPGEELSPGVWRATLTYRSANASGAAPDVTIEVP